MERGPNSSSGTEKRVNRRSKKIPPSPQTELSRRPSSDFAVPGGPSNNKCSPQNAANSKSRTSVSLSTKPNSSALVAARIFPAKFAGAPDAGEVLSPPVPSPEFKIGARSSSTLFLTASSSTLIKASCSLCLVFQSGSAAARVLVETRLRVVFVCVEQDRKPVRLVKVPLVVVAQTICAETDAMIESAYYDVALRNARFDLLSDRIWKTCDPGGDSRVRSNDRR
mmetsp:Transcript_4029/g.14804  ORF Transcript_4029/g.14804 Transcript_4029/m.14804 type:complete len:224 (+) Transcript_4029:1173-1844(+)